MKLYGSVPSPYTRAVRLYLHHHGIQFEFKIVKVFDQGFIDQYQHKTPLLKIPFLQDDHSIIYDSRNIIRYIREKYLKIPTDWDIENTITIINEYNDLLVEDFIINKSSHHIDHESLFHTSRIRRKNNAKIFLENWILNTEFDYQNIAQIYLFCLIDWSLYRKTETWDNGGPNLIEFHKKFAQHPFSLQTSPN